MSVLVVQPGRDARFLRTLWRDCPGVQDLLLSADAPAQAESQPDRQSFEWATPGLGRLRGLGLGPLRRRHCVQPAMRIVALPQTQDRVLRVAPSDHGADRGLRQPAQPQALINLVNCFGARDRASSGRSPAPGLRPVCQGVNLAAAADRLPEDAMAQTSPESWFFLGS